MEERTLWRGTSSQLVNVPVFVVCGLFFWLVVPIFFAIWRWLEVRCTIYELTTQRLRIATGILSQTIDDVELYRVKDHTLQKPFLHRVFNLGNIVLMTSDRTHPEVVIKAVAD